MFKPKGSNGSTFKIELIGRGTDIDGVGPYIAMVTTAVFFDVPVMLLVFDGLFKEFTIRFAFLTISLLK